MTKEVCMIDCPIIQAVNSSGITFSPGGTSEDLKSRFIREIDPRNSCLGPRLIGIHKKENSDGQSTTEVPIYDCQLETEISQISPETLPVQP